MAILTSGFGDLLVAQAAGSAVLDVSGGFTNNGVLDLINWSGTLPPGFVNHGILLDRSSLKPTWG